METDVDVRQRQPEAGEARPARRAHSLDDRYLPVEAIFSLDPFPSIVERQS
ncbi:MAG: hypothetical protein U9N84_02975 [Actinomycetota bacterium]|nr:hypothetical protein [Actinomycetota bacterium]